MKKFFICVYLSLRGVAVAISKTRFLVSLGMTLCVICVHLCFSESFKILGTRPLGMGGAFVAVAEDALTQYYNPAGLGIGRDVDVQIPVGVQAETTGDVVKSLTDASDRVMGIADKFNQVQDAQKGQNMGTGTGTGIGSALSLDQISSYLEMIDEIRKLADPEAGLSDPKKGLLLDVSAGANIRVSHFAFSVNNFTTLGFNPILDFNIGLGSSTFATSPKKLVGAVQKTDGIPEVPQGVDLGDIADKAVEINTKFGETHKDANGKPLNIYDPPPGDPNDKNSLNGAATTLSGGILTDMTDTLQKQFGVTAEVTDALEAQLQQQFKNNPAFKEQAAALGITSVDDIPKLVNQAIANVVINAATDPDTAKALGITPLSAQEVVDYVNQIESMRKLITEFLSSTQAGSISKNQTGVTVRGASTFEASLGYGMKVPYVQSSTVLGGVLKGLYAGANVKYIEGYIAYSKLNVERYFSLTDGGKKDIDSKVIEGELKDSYARSKAIGIDLGLLVKKRLPSPFKKKIHGGLLLRNINSPKLTQPASAKTAGEPLKYTLKPQIRAGLAVWPFNWWTIASDIDITKNETALTNYYSQLWGLGNEFNLVNRKWLNLALRAGLMKNIAESKSKLAYTAGLGLNLFHFVLDAGGAISSQNVKVSSDTEIPAAGAASVMISFQF
ncbi:MAG: hypothetical protein AB1349_11530 [Elusimicrobiota bacterium]